METVGRRALVMQMTALFLVPALTVVLMFLATS